MIDETTHCIICDDELHFSSFPTCKVCGEPMCWGCHNQLNGLCSHECYWEHERWGRSDLEGEEFEIAHRAAN